MNWLHRNEKFSCGQPENWFISLELRCIYELIFKGAYCPEDLRHKFYYPEEDKNNPELWTIWCQYYGGKSFLEFCDRDRDLARHFMNIVSVWMVIANSINDRIMDVYELLEDVNSEKGKEIISSLRMIQLRFGGSGLLDIEGKSKMRDGQDRDLFQKVCGHSIADAETMLRFAEIIEPGGDAKKHLPLNTRESNVADIIAKASRKNKVIENQEILEIYYDIYLPYDEDKESGELTPSQLSDILKSLKRKVPYIKHMKTGSRGWIDTRYLDIQIKK